MKIICNKRFILLIFLAAPMTGIQAQHLLVNLLSGITEQYPISEIRSLKFPSNSMVLYQNDGTVVSWDIADISDYSFDLTSLSAMDAGYDESNGLKIYPNPASDRVHIEYTGREQSDFLIEVIDNNGSLVEVLYRGSHAEKTSVSWNIRSASMAPGTYLCRVSSSRKVVTGKILVQ